MCYSCIYTVLLLQTDEQVQFTVLSGWGYESLSSPRFKTQMTLQIWDLNGTVIKVPSVQTKGLVGAAIPGEIGLGQGSGVRGHSR